MRTTMLRAERLEARETPAAAGTLDLVFGIGGITPEVAGAGGTSVAVESLGRVVAAGIINGVGGLLNPIRNVRC